MTQKMRMVWWGLLGLLVLIAAIKFFLPAHPPVAITQAETGREIVVYITGAVNHPGLIRLPLDARLDDALKQTGLSPDADMEALNPAQRLKDGQKIIIPAQIPLTAQNGDVPISDTGNLNSQNSRHEDKININTAPLSELDRIPGVGPVIAQRIIDYRTENGLFTSPEDIQNVPGIGAKTYEKMAAYITIRP